MIKRMKSYLDYLNQSSYSPLMKKIGRQDFLGCDKRSYQKEYQKGRRAYMKRYREENKERIKGYRKKCA